MLDSINFEIAFFEWNILIVPLCICKVVMDALHIPMGESTCIIGH